MGSFNIVSEMQESHGSDAWFLDGRRKTEITLGSGHAILVGERL